MASQPHRVAIAGSSGFLGGALRKHLLDRGDEVVSLVRRAATSPDEVTWDPTSGHLDLSLLGEVDAIVNLAGVGIGDRRWTAAHKRAIEYSRLSSTSTIAEAIASEAHRTGRRIRLVNASAVGIYGDRRDEVLTEASPLGHDFLAGLVMRWERATEAASAAHAPVALTRSGLVMAGKGGAFRPILLLAKLGLGGPLASGREWWPWITLVDEVRALAFLIDHPEVTGPVNLVAPEPARQREIARAMGVALHRPAILPAPHLAMRAVIGEFADFILFSQRVQPHKLVEAGFTFSHPTLDSAVTWMVHDGRH